MKKRSSRGRRNSTDTREMGAGDEDVVVNELDRALRQFGVQIDRNSRGGGAGGSRRHRSQHHDNDDEGSAFLSPDDIYEEMILEPDGTITHVLPSSSGHGRRQLRHNRHLSDPMAQLADLIRSGAAHMEQSSSSSSTSDRRQGFLCMLFILCSTLALTSAFAAQRNNHRHDDDDDGDEDEEEEDDEDEDQEEEDEEYDHEFDNEFEEEEEEDEENMHDDHYGTEDEEDEEEDDDVTHSEETEDEDEEDEEDEDEDEEEEEETDSDDSAQDHRRRRDRSAATTRQYTHFVNFASVAIGNVIAVTSDGSVFGTVVKLDKRKRRAYVSVQRSERDVHPQLVIQNVESSYTLSRPPRFFFGISDERPAAQDRQLQLPMALPERTALSFRNITTCQYRLQSAYHSLAVLRLREIVRLLVNRWPNSVPVVPRLVYNMLVVSAGSVSADTLHDTVLSLLRTAQQQVTSSFIFFFPSPSLCSSAFLTIYSRALSARWYEVFARAALRSWWKSSNAIVLRSCMLRSTQQRNKRTAASSARAIATCRSTWPTRWRMYMETSIAPCV